MAAGHASDLIDSYVAAFADARDVTHLYEPDALVVPRPGLALSGAQRAAAHRRCSASGCR